MRRERPFPLLDESSGASDLGEVARDRMVPCRRRGTSAGSCLGADLLRLPAARAEAAARRRVRRARHVAFEHDPLALAALVRDLDRHRREQRLRVRMHRRARRARSRVPISTILPRYITATRSEMCRTTERSWAMKRYVRPSSSCRSSSRLTTCAWIDTSSAETGSSSTISFGFSASARATPMRCRWPPENSCGKRLRVLGAQADRAQQLLDATPALVAAVEPVDPQRLGDDRRAPSSAGSATRTDPGTRSACRGASGASARRLKRRDVGAVEDDRARPSARAA